MADEAKPVAAKKPAKASKLKAVDPKAAEPAKPKMIIFGKPGVGKTWASLDFPGVFYIDTEGGANLEHYTDKLKKSGGMYLGPEQGSQDFETVIDQIKALATEEHEFKTVVIDSISKLMNIEIARETERLSERGEKNEFGRDKKPAVNFVKRLVGWLDRLDMNAILIAHERPQWGIDANGNRSEIGTTFDGYEKLEYELHLCLNITKAGEKRIAKVRKTRLLQFPDGSNFPWSFTEFAERYGRDVIDQKPKQIILASAEQLAEVQQLVKLVNLPEGQVEKWFTCAKVSAWEEMDADKVSKIIDYIKKTFINQAASKGEAA